MSDSLERLVEVEKAAARLVADAEQEAGRRKTQARLAAQARFAEESKKLTADTAKALRVLKEELREEREGKDRAYRQVLSARSLDLDAFSRLIWERIRELGR